MHRASTIHSQSDVWCCCSSCVPRMLCTAVCSAQQACTYCISPAMATDHSTVHASTPRWMIPGSMDPGIPLRVSSSSHGLDASCDAIHDMHYTLPHAPCCMPLYSNGIQHYTRVRAHHPGGLPSWDPPCRYPSHALPQTLASWMHGLGVSIHLLLACIPPWPCSGPLRDHVHAHAFCSCTHIILYCSHGIQCLDTWIHMASDISVSPYPWYGDSWYPRSP